MLVHLFSHGKTLEDEKIDIKDAIFLLNNQQDISKEPDNYIGFTLENNQDATIQFIREDKDNWIIDIPVIKNDVYNGSYVSRAKHNLVITIVTSFFSQTSKFRETIDKGDFEHLEKLSKELWNLVYSFEEDPDE